MGGPNSGRRSIKGQVIEFILDVQVKLNRFLREDLNSSMTREELKVKANEYWAQVKEIQTKLEELKESKSDKKLVKAQGIDFILGVQAMFNRLVNGGLESAMLHEELEAKVQEIWQESRSVQEELERI
jgi:hypothetical protein